MQTSRRTLIRTGLVSGTVVTLAGVPARRPRHRRRARAAAHDPFTLGVASGDPLPDGVVLWTRLALDPLADDGLGGMPPAHVPRRVAGRRRRPVPPGRPARAPSAPGRECAHAVHVEVGGLLPGPRVLLPLPPRAATSPPVGRTRTAPAYDARGGVAGDVVRLLLAVRARLVHGATAGSPRTSPTWSCTSATTSTSTRPRTYVAPSGNVRDHQGPETVTLADYRQRLRAVPAPTRTCRRRTRSRPGWWSSTTTRSTTTGPTRSPRTPPDARVPRTAAPRPSGRTTRTCRCAAPRSRAASTSQIYRRLAVGPARELPHARHPPVPRRPGLRRRLRRTAPTPHDPARSLPGPQQEQLARRRLRGQPGALGRPRPAGVLRPARQHRDAGQHGLDGRLGRLPGVARTGSPAAGSTAQVRNPVVLTGDVHAHWASDVLADFADPDSPVGRLRARLLARSPPVATGTTSRPASTRGRRTTRNLKFWTNLRGYVNTRITPDVVHRRLPLRAAGQRARAQPAFTRATFVVDDGVRGCARPTTTRAAPAAIASSHPRSDAQKIRDTLEAGVALTTDLGYSERSTPRTMSRRDRVADLVEHLGGDGGVDRQRHQCLAALGVAGDLHAGDVHAWRRRGSCRRCRPCRGGPRR